MLRTTRTRVVAISQSNYNSKPILQRGPPSRCLYNDVPEPMIAHSYQTNRVSSSIALNKAQNTKARAPFLVLVPTRDTVTECRVV